MGVMEVVQEQRDIARAVLRKWAKAKTIFDAYSDEDMRDLKARIAECYGTKGVSYDRISVLGGTISNPTAETAERIERLQKELEHAINSRLEQDASLLTVYNAVEYLLSCMSARRAGFLRDSYAIPEGRRVPLSVQQLSEMYNRDRSTIYRMEREAIDEFRMLDGFERIAVLADD